MSVYGQPQLRLENDQTDRIGIRTLVLSQFWQPSRWPLSQQELAQEKPSTPDTGKSMSFIGEQTRPVRGGLRTSWTFEGINGDGSSVTFKDRKNSIDYRFDPGFSERTLLLFPSIGLLLEDLGGTVLDGQIIWQPTIPQKKQGSGTTKNDKNAGKPNPMFGRQTFLFMDGQYTHRYVAKEDEVDSLVSDGVGWSFSSENLPGKAPKMEPVKENDKGIKVGRNWLKMMPQYIRRGPVYDITEVYWLSGEGGWPEELYPNYENAGAAAKLIGFVLANIP